MPLRIGLIGAGDRGRMRLDLLTRMTNVVCIGVSDLIPERAHDLAHQYGIPAFQSAYELLNQADMVCVATTTRDHFLLAENIIKQGKHLFLEWPPTTSTTECERLIALAEEAGVEIGVSSPRRFRPWHKVWPQGHTPTLLIYQIYGQPADTGPLPWPNYLAEVIDFCCAIIGTHNVRRIEAQAMHDPIPVLETAAFGMRFHNGAYAQVCVRREAQHYREPLTIVGPNIRLEVDLHTRQARRYTWNPNNDPSFETLEVPEVNPFEAELYHFTASISRGQSYPVSILEAFKTMRLVEQLLTSLR